MCAAVNCWKPAAILYTSTFSHTVCVGTRTVPWSTTLVIPQTELVVRSAKKHEVKTLQNVHPLNYSHALMKMISIHQHSYEACEMRTEFLKQSCHWTLFNYDHNVVDKSCGCFVGIWIKSQMSSHAIASLTNWNKCSIQGVTYFSYYWYGDEVVEV